MVDGKVKRERGRERENISAPLIKDKIASGVSNLDNFFIPGQTSPSRRFEAHPMGISPWWSQVMQRIVAQFQTYFGFHHYLSHD